MFTLNTGETLQGVAGSASAITYTVTGDEKAGLSDTFKVLTQGQLPSSAGVLYTVPVSTMAMVQKIFLANTTAGAVVATLYINGTAATNQIVRLAIPANGSAIFSHDGWTVYDASGLTTSVGSVTLTGDITGTGVGSVPTVLPVVNAGVGSFGSPTAVPVLTVNAKGQVTAAGSSSIQIVPAQVTGLSFFATLANLSGDITTTGSGATTLPNINPNVGSFGSASAVATQTVNAKGQTTAAATVPIAIAESQVTNLVTDLAGKQATGNYLTSLTGHVTASGPGAGAATIASGVVTNAMQANAPANTMSGNFTATPAAPQDSALAANQFFARAAAGDIGPKPITTFGLSWLNQASVAAATAALDVATTTTAGTMSFIDKKRMVTLQYSLEADFGGVGDDSTLNDTAFSTAYSTMPVGSKLNIGAGTFRVAAAIDINVDKRIQHQGTGRYNTIIKTTSATAHIFTKSVAGWYDSWSDMGFQSTVTKTAGAAINIPVGNNVGMNIYRCWFTGMFHAINATGAQSANLSVWSDLDISAVTNGGRGIFINGSTINVQIHNTTINAGAATTSACLEIQQSGAVQVTSFDWIMGTNVILINATTGSGPQACYFTNGFCDQPQGSVIKIVGTQTANRIKFTAVGIAPTGNNHGIEINGTGAGGVGTATALPAGLSIVDCDIYCQSGTSTGAGVFVNGVQDVNIQNNRITGFGGANGAGIRVAGSAGNVTSVRANGNIIGPNSNLTVTNSIGIDLQAGSSGLKALSITDNSLLGSTIPLQKNHTMAAGAIENINNNTPCPEGFSVGATYGQTVLTTVDTIVMSMPIAANTLRVGQRFLIRVHGTVSLASAVNARVRIGTAGTTADTAVLLVATSTSAAGGHSADLIATITAVGAGTSTFHAAGVVNTISSAGTALSPAFSSTVANFLTLSLASGTSNTLTVRGGFIQAI